MKKFLALLLSALLVAAILAVPASALTWEDNQTMDGENYVFDNAYGFVFNVGSVNGKIVGEDCTVITNVVQVSRILNMLAFVVIYVTYIGFIFRI